MRRFAKLAVSALLVDREPLYRAGIAGVFSSTSAIRVVGQASDPAEAVGLVQSLTPDLVLIDPSLDERFAMVERMRLCDAHLKVIALGDTDDPGDVAAAISAGIRGYVPRTVEPGGLMEAVERVLRGELYVAPSIGWQLLSRLSVSRRIEPPKALPGVKFTVREEEIMLRVAGGATNKEVARDLAVSVKTVKHHLTNVMQKLKVRNRVEAVVAYRSRGGEGAAATHH